LGIVAGRKMASFAPIFEELLEDLFPLTLDLVLISRIDRMNLRKFIAPGERSAGVDDRARVGEISGRPLRRRDARVDGAAPAAGCDLDRGLRIASCRHRPENVLHVGWVDV